MREQKGVTLVGVLGLLSVLALLVIVAYPVYMKWNRGSTDQYLDRAIRASVNVTRQETSQNLALYDTGLPIEFKRTYDDSVCYQSPSPLAGEDCAEMGFEQGDIFIYKNIDDIVSATVMHHNIGRLEISPYDGSPLVNAGSMSKPGHLTIYSPDGESILISGWDRKGALLLNATATGFAESSVPETPR